MLRVELHKLIAILGWSALRAGLALTGAEGPYRGRSCKPSTPSGKGLRITGCGQPISRKQDHERADKGVIFGLVFDSATTIVFCS